MQTVTERPDTPRWRSWLLWAAQILLAAVFFAAGGSKLAGVERMVELFAQIGFGQWFRGLTGTLEVIGAALLLWPATAFWGALLVGGVMIGAVFTHLALIGGSPVPALVLLALAALVAWGRRPA